MDGDKIKKYASAGLTVALASGALRLVTKINVGSGTIIESMGKIFLLVTVTAAGANYLDEYVKKKPLE